MATNLWPSATTDGVGTRRQRRSRIARRRSVAGRGADGSKPQGLTHEVKTEGGLKHGSKHGLNLKAVTRNRRKLRAPPSIRAMSYPVSGMRLVVNKYLVLIRPCVRLSGTGMTHGIEAVACGQIVQSVLSRTPDTGDDLSALGGATDL